MSKRRRKVDPTERLSDQMRDILLRVYNYERPEPAPGTYLRTATGEILVNPEMTLNRIVETFMPWRPSEIIGVDPTPSKTAALSNALKRLDERGLLDRLSVVYNKDGKVTRMAMVSDRPERMRTTHVRLTGEGVAFARSLIHDDVDLEADKRKEEWRKVERQVRGLSLALDVLKERIEQRTGDETGENAYLGWKVVNETLDQIIAEIRGEQW